MSMFNPSPSYEGLLRQAKSLHALVNSQDNTISYLQGEIKELRLNLHMLDKSEMEGQRKANQELTNLIQEKDETIEDLREQLRVLDEYVKDLQCERQRVKVR